jgi:hypothetical protein
VKQLEFNAKEAIWLNVDFKADFYLSIHRSALDGEISFPLIPHERKVPK